MILVIGFLLLVASFMNYFDAKKKVEKGRNTDLNKRFAIGLMIASILFLVMVSNGITF